jgi:hypothetical protein
VRQLPRVYYVPFCLFHYGKCAYCFHVLVAVFDPCIIYSSTNVSLTFVISFLLCSYNPNGMVVGLVLGFCTITFAAVFIEWYAFDPFLQYVTLFYGVFFGVYSIRDIYDDLITRRAEGSDAMACHALFPCCLPRCVGVQFWCLAVIFQVVGLYLAMVWLMSDGN